MSQWIWKFGEFEIYHNMLLHNRRDQYGYREAPVWKMFSPENVVRFSKRLHGQAGEVHLAACGYHTTSVFDAEGNERKYRGRASIPLAAGDVQLQVTVSNPDSFPSLFAEGAVETDGSWLATDLACAPAPVGTYARFGAPEEPPDVFPFHYEPVAPVRTEKAGGGLLFDFGRETFAKTTFFMPGGGPLFVSLGESREEALDPEWSVIHFTLEPENGKACLPAKAFRYIFVNRPGVTLKAEYEYLALERRGSFHTGEEVIDRVWETAAYTFHLNSREFILDGIKRDRWVWAGDVYQSLFVNRYLFFDAELEKRSLIALGGKRPFEAHINTIMDYSFLWLISLYEHYQTYGDDDFVRQIMPQAREVMGFCLARADGDGFVREREGDWVFIDWAPMDKTGALCGEQILFAKAMKCYASLCAVAGAEDGGCAARAAALQKAIVERFYEPEKGAFVDSFESGRHTVTRQSNALAYLFLPLTPAQKQAVYQNVMLNDAVRQITTPYFKFYENRVHCEAGNTGLLESSLRGYYGNMLATGATTLYEEYDPTQQGAAHYAMYGNPYEKSLCHAWSASPIYLLGRYRAGVRSTGVGYSSFLVEPVLGDLPRFNCIAPLPGGRVEVDMDPEKVRVLATRPGGTLRFQGAEYPLVENEALCLRLSK